MRNTWKAPAKDNTWFNYRIRVVGKTIQTFIDGRLICEYAEPAEPYRPQDKAKRRLGSGTFALQAHDPGSVVKYQDIKVKLLPNDAAPPAALVPLADRALDELVTQASNDNIPLIDLGLEAPRGDAVAFWREVHRYGLTPGSEFGDTELADRPQNVVVVMDDETPPIVELIKQAKGVGAKFAFSSGSAGVDAARLEARLAAIKAAGLGWKDFWVPGKSE